LLINALNTLMKLFIYCLLLIASHLGFAQSALPLGTLPDGQAVRFVQNPDKTYGLAIGETVRQPKPVEGRSVSFSEKGRGGALDFSEGYQTVRVKRGVAECRYTNDAVRLEDDWKIVGEAVRLHRTIHFLRDPAPNTDTWLNLGFRLERITTASIRDDYELFVPGIVYGITQNLPSKAIGGALCYEQRNEGGFLVREDRLPIPMTAMRWPNGYTITVLNASPTAITTLEDSEDFRQVDGAKEQQKTPAWLADEQFSFGSILAAHRYGNAQLGFAYPGSEAPVTYRGNTYPDVGITEQRPRFWPLRKGRTHEMTYLFRFTKTPDFPTLMRESWRWAWQQLRPATDHYDLSVAQQALVAQLSSQVEERTLSDGSRLTGIPNWRPAVAADTRPRDPYCIMGFTGKALETAEFLLWAADNLKGNVPDDTLAAYRRKGEGLFNNFARRVKLSPPDAEGFHLDKGTPGDAYPVDKIGYLRSYGDDLKATLRAIRREAKAGRQHPDWLAWVRSFGDWLLTQQRPSGGLPRAWHLPSGAVQDSSLTSTYNAIPMLVLLSEQIDPSNRGDDRYWQAAIRAGEYSWSQSGQRFGRFTGGTIDNPDVLDKEAGTLSLEAYLALYEAAKRRNDPAATQWLTRARAAADFAATWIYGWNVPMPADAPDSSLAWKRGISTVGIQLIATGHSLVDHYMAYDADEYARLYRYTNDPFYRDIARLMLHNSLNMTGLPQRTYDLRGPGWQQEHWSLAPWRGHGFHRGWLPWVSCSHLNGMIGLQEFDAALFAELAR
jgi:hypothetical protein